LCWGHNTRIGLAGSVWIERFLVAETELFALKFKGERIRGRAIDLGLYMSAERAAAAISKGAHDDQVAELSKLDIPSLLAAWNGVE